MNPSTWLLIVSLSAFLGLLLSTLLTYKHYGGSTPLDTAGGAFCDFGSVVQCSAVLTSEWAYLFRTPIAVLGWSYNVVLLVASEMARQEVMRKTRLDARCFGRLDALWMLVLGGLGFVVYLIGVEAYLGKICPLCTVIHVLTAFAALGAYKARQGKPVRPTALPDHWITLLLLAAALFGGPLAYANRNHLPFVQRPAHAQEGMGLMDCLIAQKVEVIGHRQCAACREQQKLLGADAALVYRDVKVDDPTTQLQQPEWKLDGMPHHTGILTPGQLAISFNC